MIYEKAIDLAKKIAPPLTRWAFSLFVVNATSYIFSAPILLWWGMPLSGLSFIGNIIFAPVLAVFIMLCALFMGTSFVGLSPDFLKIPLETTTEWWFWALNFGSKRFLYAQIAHPIIILIAIIIVLVTGWWILRSTTKALILKGLISGGIATTLLFAIPLKNAESSLTNKSGSLTIKQPQSGFITIDDTGFFKGIKTPAKGIPFNVKRPIIQAHGTLCIKKFTTTILSTRTLESIAELIICMDVREINLPHIHPPQTASVWRALARIRKLAKEQNVRIKYAKNSYYTPKLRTTPLKSSNTFESTSEVRSGHKMSKKTNSEYAA